MPEKSSYVVVAGDSIKGKYDLYVTPWGDLRSLVKDHLDDVEDGVPVTLTFTVYEWTDAEYEAFLAEHEIEVDDVS